MALAQGKKEVWAMSEEATEAFERLKESARQSTLEREDIVHHMNNLSVVIQNLHRISRESEAH